jgi:hypothetical protein
MTRQRELPSVAVSTAAKKRTVSAMNDEHHDKWARAAVRELMQRCLRGLAQHFTALACGLDPDELL